MIKEKRDCLEGTTEGNVGWGMINMDSELVTPSLSHTLGPGLGKVLNSYSKPLKTVTTPLLNSTTPLQSATERG